MFQKKDIEAYQETKAPVELKNRIQSSIEQQRRRIRKQQMSFLAAAAGFSLILSVGGLFDNSTILSVNDKVVTNEAVEIYSTARSGSVAISTAMQVPMEIQIKESTQVQVSHGTLQLLEADGTSEERTELEISENALIYWNVDANTTSTPTCTITTNDKTYVYVMEYDDAKSVFIIKQKQ